MIVFLLAHAGGAACAYPALFPRLASHTELIPLDLPGHGLRGGEAPLRDIPAMTREMTAMAERFLGHTADRNAPYAIFGHSMGGLLAFLLALALEDNQRPAAHVFISSSAAPGRHYVPQGITELGDEELWQQSAAYFGGISREILENSELIGFFAPLLRADLRAVTSFKPEHVRAVDAPLTALYGERDVVDEADMAIWRRYSTGKFSCRALKGGHFHQLENPAPCESILLEELKPWIQCP